jgi:hypothetical protein
VRVLFDIDIGAPVLQPCLTIYELKLHNEEEFDLMKSHPVKGARYSSTHPVSPA